MLLAVLASLVGNQHPCESILLGVCLSHMMSVNTLHSSSLLASQIWDSSTSKASEIVYFFVEDEVGILVELF